MLVQFVESVRLVVRCTVMYSVLRILKVICFQLVSFEFFVGGTKICPASASETIYPCTRTGQCVFNATRRATQCKCPVGLQGKRCRQG